MLLYSAVRDTCRTLEDNTLPKPRAAKLETATARRRLVVRKKPFWFAISPGIGLGYRRNAGAGTWSVRVTDGHGADWIKRLALADDYEPADGSNILTYWQAIDAARGLARRQDGDDGGRPLTVSEALSRYEADLRLRGGDVYNTARVRRTLSASLLAKPVQLVTAIELRRWRDSLVANGLAASSANRTRTGLKAALTLAASLDERVTNARAWRIGLTSLPDANKPRGDVVLADAQVVKLLACAREVDPRFGLFVAVLALGARASQAARLRVCDLQPDRVMMPTSKKGRGTKAIRHYPVPIPATLADALAKQAHGRPADAPLLTRSDGRPWGYGRSSHKQRNLFRAAAASAGLDPDRVTPYSLRHSAIVRMLRRNVPIRLVASLCDTSSTIIEHNYSAFITHHADELARSALLEPPSLRQP
jgi:integrase